MDTHNHTRTNINPTIPQKKNIKTGDMKKNDKSIYRGT